MIELNLRKLTEEEKMEVEYNFTTTDDSIAEDLVNENLEDQIDDIFNIIDEYAKKRNYGISENEGNYFCTFEVAEILNKKFGIVFLEFDPCSDEYYKLYTM